MKDYVRNIIFVILFRKNSVFIWLKNELNLSFFPNETDDWI